MAVLKLRPYQEECLQSIHNHYTGGVNRQLVHLPTAAGKTVIFSNLIRELDRKTLVIAHTCELLDQAREKIQMICPGLDVGIVKAGRREYDCPVVVCSIQSARQPETLIRLKDLGFTLCIYDECHRAGAQSPRHVLSTLGFTETSDNLLVGFSATPFRSDSKGLGEVFEKIVYHKSVKELIEEGYLCKPRGVRITNDLDLSAVATVEGDFVSTSLAKVMDTPQMNELIVNTYVQQAGDRKTVCFGVTIAHSIHLANEFKRRGITAEAIHGETPVDERKAIQERFRAGDIAVLTNCTVLTEGWDCPEVDCVLIAKPTQSAGLFQQMAGRGLRLYPNKKDCLILDFGSKSHSLCSMGVLVGDAEKEHVGKKQCDEGKSSEFARSLPLTLNKKLRSAVLECDLFGDSFSWSKDGCSFTLKGAGGRMLKIYPTADGRFSVMFFSGVGYQTIAEAIPFEYAFACAEDFARSNRGLFVFSDLDAAWRQRPITDKQKTLFRSNGYKSGIDDLTRGQAATIISSGVLNRKAARR